MTRSPTLAGTALVLAALTTFLLPSSGTAADGDAKGNLSYKGTTVALKHAYLIKGPDAVDPKKIIRRVILSKTDLGAKIRACKTMSCVGGEITEGMEVDFDAGERLNFWVGLNDGRLQFSGTAKPSAVKTTADSAKRLAGKLSFDDTTVGGPRVDVEFDVSLLKEFTAAR